MIIGSHGKPIPRELGLRGMVVFDGRADQPPALFVTTWSPARGPGRWCCVRKTGGISSPPASGAHGLPVTTIRTITHSRAACHHAGRLAWRQSERLGALGRLRKQRPGPRRLGAGVRLRLRRSNNKTSSRWWLRRPSLCRHPQSRGLPDLAQHLRRRAALRLRESDRQGAYRGPLNQCALSMAFKGALYVGSGIQGGGVDTRTRSARATGVDPHPSGRQLGPSRRRQPGYARRAQECLSGYLPDSTISSTATSGSLRTRRLALRQHLEWTSILG